MKMDLSIEDAPQVDLLAETERLYREVAEELAVATRRVSDGDMGEVGNAVRAVKDLRAAFQMVMDERTRVTEIEMNHQGARNAGRPMLLEGGLDWKPMGFSPSDMEFHETKLAAAREIAIAFGVPPMILGIPGDATYANYQEANRAFYRLTVLPLASKVVAAVSHWLSSFSGEEVELRPDLDQVPALAAERDQQWKRVGDADFLTVAEKRVLLGLPRVAEE